MFRAEVDHGVAELVQDPDRPQSTLLLDGTAQSHRRPADPEHLEFEFAGSHLVDLAGRRRRLLRVLHWRRRRVDPGPLRRRDPPGSPQTIANELTQCWPSSSHTGCPARARGRRAAGRHRREARSSLTGSRRTRSTSSLTSSPVPALRPGHDGRVPASGSAGCSHRPACTSRTSAILAAVPARLRRRARCSSLSWR
ncbi:hypothetical protein HBB16_18750 [Pseudonocardia sp. MCCB 268]|nr:hypothetical protein [Pseudonocardia cytotoxica]